MDIDAAFKRAQELARSDKRAEALALYNGILAQAPNEPEILRHAIEMLAADDVPAAERLCRHLCAIEPQTGVNWGLLAGCRSWHGAHEEAGRLYEKALRLSPDMPTQRWNYALNLLLRGDYERGWEEYRWGVVSKHLRIRHLRPEWDGSPIPGKTLFLWAEQGHGDAIMLARFIRQAREQSQCAHVVLECHEGLVSLFAANGLAHEVYALRRDGSIAWEWDEHASMMSLPRILGVRAHDLLSGPYLTANAMPGLPACGLKVGICTRGNPAHGNDKNRSTDFAMWDGILRTAGCTFYNLDRDTSSLPMADWLQTASIVAGLDLVITVDTGAAHLAGAMGVPAWVLLPFAGDWRWGADGQYSPWYPNSMLARQPSYGEWPAVFDMIERKLAEIASPDVKAVLRVGWDNAGASDGLIPREDFERAANDILRAGTTRHAQALHGLVRWLKPRVCVEVGTWHGYTALWIARALQENGRGEVYCIDDFSLEIGAIALDQLQEHIQACCTGEVMAILPGKSAEVEWPECDFAYIDGDHSQEGCKADIDRAIAAGATCIAFHDTTSWWGPRELIDQMRRGEIWDGWDFIEVPFDEGLAVMMKRPQKPGLTYARDDFPKGLIEVIASENGARPQGVGV